MSLDDLYAHYRKGDETRDLMRQEMNRLLAEAPAAPPEIGQHVIVAAGLIGRGVLWVRTECVVTSMADNSVKVKNVCRIEDWEEWIHPALIIDTLTPATEVADEG